MTVRLAALLVSLALPLTAAARTPLDPSGAVEGVVEVDATVGYMTTDQVFDEDGEKQDLGAEATAIPVTVALEYGLGGDLSAGLDLSFLKASGEAGSIEVEGSGLREAILGLTWSTSLGPGGLDLRGGLKVDLGKDPDDLDADEVGTSDNQGGLLLDGSYGLSLTDEVSASLSLLVVSHFESDDEIKSGLVLAPTLGLSYRVAEAFAVGLALGYVSQGESEVAGDSVDDSDSSLLHVLPWLSYRIQDAGTLLLALGFRAEDVTIGYPLSGKNAVAPGTPPFTLAWRMSF